MNGEGGPRGDRPQAAAAKPQLTSSVAIRREYDREQAERVLEWLRAGCPRPKRERPAIFADPTVEADFRSWQVELHLRSDAALRSEVLETGIRDPDHPYWSPC